MARAAREHAGVFPSTIIDMPLSLGQLFRHGLANHGDSRVSTYDGVTLTRTTYAEIGERVERVASALASLGVRPGDRIATLAWNHDRHLELYWAVPCMGAVLHPLNLRLAAAQLRDIVEHAGDRVLVADASLLGLLEPVADELRGIEHVVVVGGDPPAAFSGAVPYENLVAAAAPRYAWPAINERSAATLCYTTGTTGKPKGVAYSHRSLFLHSLGSCGGNAFALSQADTILLSVPMFHANAWGLPYSGWSVGAELVLPREFLQGHHLLRLLTGERCTFFAGVPTILDDISACAERDSADLSSLRLAVSGGSAVPRRLVERWRDRHGVPVLQGWGMTETGPVCALAWPPPGTPPDEEVEWRITQGRAVPGVEIRVTGPEGDELSRDGVSVGELEVRGPWVTGSYVGGASPERFHDGWLRTGDVGTIDAHGYVRLTDRLKDVIKSGGEWISSLELEDHLLTHPAVLEAAVIGVADPRWQERPLACVVLRDGAAASAAELRDHLETRVQRWWLPERFAFVAELPKTGVGKLDKRALREQEARGALPVELLS